MKNAVIGFPFVDLGFRWRWNSFRCFDCRQSGVSFSLNRCWSFFRALAGWFRRLALAFSGGALLELFQLLCVVSEGMPVFPEFLAKLVQVGAGGMTAFTAYPIFLSVLGSGQNVAGSQKNYCSSNQWGCRSYHVNSMGEISDTRSRRRL